MSKNLVVFDFCDTITNFQTADAFVRFVNQKNPTLYSSFILKLADLLIHLRFFAILNRIFPKRGHIKRFNLLSLRGRNRETIQTCAEQFFWQRIVPNYHDEIIRELRNCVANNQIVVVSSGGYDSYLKLFCAQESVPFLHSTEIAFKGEKCLGVFDGPDCMYEQKVVKLQELIKKHNLNFEKKIVYSDSASDMPLFQWADEGFVVSKGKSQKWAADANLKEIIIKQ
jgi:HAD superfamily phosphoserine phosphatase-like hydrolase